MISGPTRVFALARIADVMRAAAARTFVEERVGDARLDQDARAGQADLARVHVLPGDGLRRGVEVGVGADDERRLAAELGARPA